jgi:uncharacterized protein
LIDIPYEQLSPEALRGILEEFVSRDGCEFTAVGVKADEVERLVRAGKAKIVFDPGLGSCQVLPCGD